MYTVYKITNNVNQKQYIGSSVNVNRRWKRHINAAFNSNAPSYQYPLQRAFRKYGVESFSFEVIRDDFDSIEEMEDYEQIMIDEYNTLAPSGYNQTRETHSNTIAHENSQRHIQKISKKCAKVDKNENIIEVYSSYHDAARKNGYDGDNYASQVRLVCNGKQSSVNNDIFRNLDENGKIISKPLLNYKGKKPIIGIDVENPCNERFFESISQAAQILNTDRASIGKCIKGDKRYSIIKGYIFRELTPYGDIIQNDISIEDRIIQYNNENPVINGERHSISQWCKIYNISTSSFYKRRNKGMSVVDAITSPKKR